MKKRRDNLFIALAALQILIVFGVGIFVPLGIAAAVPYAYVVLFTFWISGTRFTYLVGVVTSFLAILGVFFAPDPMAFWAVVIANRAISVIGIWIAVFVIIRLKAIETVKNKSKSQLEALFQFAVEGMLIANQKGEIILLNPAVEKMFGYIKEELIGKKVESLLPERFGNSHVAKRDAYLKNPQSRPMGQGLSLCGRKKDGLEFPLELSLSYFVANNENFAIAFIVDITERKQKEKLIVDAKDKLEMYSKALESSNADLEQFANIASHDLQEPLRKIQSFGGLLKTKESENLSEQGKDYVDRMSNAAARMQKLINDLLMFSRITKATLEFEEVNLNTVLSDVLSDLELSIEKKNIKIISKVLPVIQANRTQMHQLFQNIISNAIKFSNSEDSKLQIYSSSKDENTIQLCFEDNGIGFDEKYLPKIFTIFQRLESNKYEGSGIGLAVCEKIANQHGGSIIAKSIPGKGATFTITLAIYQKNVQF